MEIANLVANFEEWLKIFDIVVAMALPLNIAILLAVGRTVPIGGWLLLFYLHSFWESFFVFYASVLAIYHSKLMFLMWEESSKEPLFLIILFGFSLIKIITGFCFWKLIYISNRNKKNLLFLKFAVVFSIIGSFLFYLTSINVVPDITSDLGRMCFKDFVLFFYLLFSYRVKFVFIKFPDSWDYDKFKKKLPFEDPLDKESYDKGGSL